MKEEKTPPWYPLNTRENYRVLVTSSLSETYSSNLLTRNKTQTTVILNFSETRRTGKERCGYFTLRTCSVECPDPKLLIPRDQLWRKPGVSHLALPTPKSYSLIPHPLPRVPSRGLFILFLLVPYLPSTTREGKITVNSRTTPVLRDDEVLRDGF